MKLFKATSHYGAYLRQWYRRHPGHRFLPYSEQKARLDADCFAWFDAWDRALRPHGWSTFEAISNAEPLQRAWAREADSAWDASNWRQATVIAQARAWAPDVLFIDDPVAFDAAFVRHVRTVCPTIRAVVTYCGGAVHSSDTFAESDLVLTCLHSLVDMFASRGLATEYVAHAFDPVVLDRIRPSRTTQPRDAVLFVGQIVGAPDYHFSREAVLVAMSARVPLDLRVPTSVSVREVQAKNKAKRLIASTTGGLVARADSPMPVRSELAPFTRPAVYGLEMYEALRQARVAFNAHADVAGAEAANQRLFEATGVGACLLTDAKDNLGDFFQADSEVVVWSTPEEAADKARWLLDHPAEATRIAARGQKRTLGEHTWQHRAPQIDRYLRDAVRRAGPRLPSAPTPDSAKAMPDVVARASGRPRSTASDRLRPALRDLLPPLLLRTLRRTRQRGAEALRATGDYPTWGAALQDSTGYDTPVILERTRAALAQVRDGHAAYERDAVLFREPDHALPLLAGLLRAAAENGNALSVVDFGGALGSSYFQCRDFLAPLDRLRWSVVEQPGHVTCGRAEFANDQLQFYETIDECLREQTANVLLLSGVVHYLPAPYAFLEEVLQHAFQYVIIDRTPFMRDDRDRLTVEHVPEWLYPASYPAWFLSETRFLLAFEAKYEQLVRFTAIDTLQPEGGEADFRGFLFRLKDPPR